MNGVYLRALPPGRVRGRGSSRTCASRGIDWPEERVRAAAPLVQEKIGRLGEFPAFAGFLFDDVEPDPALLDARDPRAPRPTRSSGVEPWTAEAIEAALKQLCDELGEKPRTRLPADPRRRDRLAGLAGPLREPRAARPRDVARTAPRRRRGGGVSDAPRARRRRARADVVARGHTGAHRRVRGGDRRSAVDPRRSRAGCRRTVRNDHRPRLPHALVVRADALRGASAERRHGRELRGRTGCASRRRFRPEAGSADGSGCLEWRRSPWAHA